MPTTIKEDRFARAVAQSFDKMRRFRKSRLMLINEFVGPYYGSEMGGEARKPINMIWQATSTFVPYLAWNNPKTKVTTRQLQLRPYASMMGLALDHLAEEVELSQTLRAIVTDAIFGCGIMKVGLCPKDGGRTGLGYLHDAGQVFMDRVSLDHYVVDSDARNREEAAFEGDRYRIDVEYAMELGIYDNDALRRLPRLGDTASRNRAEDVSNSSRTDIRESMYDYVELVDLWVPAANAVVTVAAPINDTSDSLPSNKWLRTVEWQGPERGPYEMLGFAWAPDNLMPVAPAGIWLDLAELVNVVADRIAREAKRAKSVLVAERKMEEDARTITDAADGETVLVDDLDAVKLFEWGGSSAKNINDLAIFLEQFSRQSGNVEQLGGVRSSASTATQAEILQANSNIRMDDMQALVFNFVAANMKKAAWYLHTDPTIQLPLIKRMGQHDVQLVMTPEVREGDFLDYHFQIEPYSMRRQDPQMRLRNRMEWYKSVVFPSVELAMLTQGMFNANKAIQDGAQDLGITDSDELWPDPFTFQMRQAEMAAGPQPAQASMQPNAAGGVSFRRPERFNRDDGDRSRANRGGDEGSTSTAMIDQTRGNRLQQRGGV